MSKLRDKYLAKRKANVIQDAPPVVEVKQSVWDTIFDGLRFEGDFPDDIYEDALEAVWVVKDLLEDIGLSPDHKYSVAEIGRLQAAIERALGGGR